MVQKMLHWLMSQMFHYIEKISKKESSSIAGIFKLTSVCETNLLVTSID